MRNRVRIRSQEGSRLIGTHLEVESCHRESRCHMPILSETTLAPRRSQIFDGHADHDLRQQKQDGEDGWVEHFIQRLVEALRRIGRGK
jgi:hypothetical protein